MVDRSKKTRLVFPPPRSLFTHEKEATFNTYNCRVVVGWYQADRVDRIVKVTVQYLHAITPCHIYCIVHIDRVVTVRSK